VKTNRHVPFIIGVVCLIAAYFLITRFDGLVFTMLGGLALGGAYHSIKDAIFLTDKEIEDATKF